MPRAGLALILLALATCPAGAAAPPQVAEQWIVVHSPEYREALSPLIEHRRAQGLRVVVVPWTDRDGSRLQARLHQLCRGHTGPSSILLVGAPHLRGTISRMKGEPTDAPYGCLDGTRLPSVPVGRFPARSADDVRAMVRKTLALETDRAPHPWRRRLTVLAGIPAYNPVVDGLLEAMAFARFDRIHPSWTGRALYTSATSRFCVPDKQIRSQAIEYIQEGQAVILYLGHSNAEGLYAGPGAAFLDRGDWARLKIAHGQSVFLTFGCNGCQLAGRDGEGYGLFAMRNPHGPAAVLGSHGICFAAMVQLACDELFTRAFEGRLPRRLGNLWLAALTGVAKGPIGALRYRMLDAVDGDPNISQRTQRQEHLEMFVLLGDPALRLPQLPEDLEVSVENTITPGAALLVKGRLPERLRKAKVSVSLVRSPASTPAGLEPLPPAGPPREWAMLANHRRANQFTVAATTAEPSDGAFTARLEVPANARWPRLTLRIYAADGSQEALAVRRVTVADGRGRP